MAEPDFTVSDEDKFALVQHLVVPLCESLARLSSQQALTADDYIDTLAMALGALLANDSNLKSAQDVQAAGEIVGKYVEAHTARFRDIQNEEGGLTVFEKLVTIVEIGGTVN